MRNITVSDFTLKNAADTSCQLTFRDKTNIAVCLDGVGVDAIELAPIKNEKEDAVVNRTIAGLVKNCTVKISGGLTVDSIAKAWDSIKDAKDPCIRIYIPSSTALMEYTCHLKAPKMLEFAQTLCKSAKEKCNKVEVVAVDATRADRDFLKQLCKVAECEGVVSVTLCDDAGIFTPDEFGDLVADIKANCNINICVMASNAISMAAANAVKAINMGADGVEVAVGNGWLDTAVFSDVMLNKGNTLGVDCRLDASAIHRDIDEVMHNRATGDKAVSVVDSNAHSEISLNNESTLSEVCEVVRSLGYELSHEDSGKVYEEFKRVSAKKENIGFKEIDAMVASVAMQVPSTYHVESYVINNGNIITSTANITLSRDGEKFNGISTGDGPINAAFLAIEQIIGHHYELDDFQIQAITEGHEAVGSALVKLRSGETLYSGVGISTDIIGASIRAYVNALNKIVHNEQ